MERKKVDQAILSLDGKYENNQSRTQSGHDETWARVVLRGRLRPSSSLSTAAVSTGPFTALPAGMSRDFACC